MLIQADEQICVPYGPLTTAGELWLSITLPVDLFIRTLYNRSNVEPTCSAAAHHIGPKAHTR